MFRSTVPNLDAWLDQREEDTLTLHPINGCRCFERILLPKYIFLLT
jgi:hypothetical protein